MTRPDPRFTLANERTALAWVRTGLAFVAAGLGASAAAQVLDLNAFVAAAGMATAGVVVVAALGLGTALVEAIG